MHGQSRRPLAQPVVGTVSRMITAKRFVYISAAVPFALCGVQVKAEVCRSIITTTVREQHPISHH